MAGMKVSVDKEMFGVLYLQGEDTLRPDDAARRLLYRNVSSLWLQLADTVSNKVYEAPVEKLGSGCVVLKLSSKLVTALHLYDTCDVIVNAQFQLNRWPLFELHSAIDRLSTAQLRLLFPEPRVPVVRSEVSELNKKGYIVKCYCHGTTGIDKGETASLFLTKHRRKILRQLCIFLHFPC